jgi:hypothetical protein
MCHRIAHRTAVMSAVAEDHWGSTLWQQRTDASKRARAVRPIVASALSSPATHSRSRRRAAAPWCAICTHHSDTISRSKGGALIVEHP